MLQSKFSLTPNLNEFVNDYKSYGYKDKSSLVQAALQRFQEEIERQRIIQSAELYAEVYDEDSDLQELTEAAIEEWPQ